MKLARLSLLFISFCFPVTQSASKVPPRMSVQHLKNVLRQQGFTGSLKGDIAFKDLGPLGCGTDEYRVFYFSWAEMRPGGIPGHGQQRLLLIGAGERYLGSFEIEDPPLKVKFNMIEFSHNPEDVAHVHCEDGARLYLAWPDGSEKDLWK
jgi:hypothetical protein